MAARCKMALVLSVAIQAAAVLCLRSADGESNESSSVEKIQEIAGQGGRRHIIPQWQYDGIPIETGATRRRLRRPLERAPAEERIRAQDEIARVRAEHANVRAQAEKANIRGQAEMSRVRALAENEKIRARSEKTKVRAPPGKSKARLFGDGRRHVTPLWQYNGIANEQSRRGAHWSAPRSQTDSPKPRYFGDGRRDMTPLWSYDGITKEPSGRRAYRPAQRSQTDNPQPKRSGHRRHQSRKAAPTPETSDEAWSPIATERTTTSTTAAEPVFPPLDPRYRRIYNADETAKIEDYPFIAAILVNNELWCGGAIINGDSVLTAAHCLQLQYNNRFFREYVKMLSVRVGSSNATYGGEFYRVTELFFHPNYKPQSLEFNFALVKLNKNITFKDAKVQPITVSRNKVVPIDKTVTFLGWGSVLGVGENGGQVLLQKLDLPVYDLFDCQEIYGRDLVTRSNFCAGYISMRKNVCNHDAGGPAIMDGVLTGVLSFSSKRCDETDKPAVFSNTGHAAEWLDSVWETRSKAEKETVPGWLNPLESKKYIK